MRLTGISCDGCGRQPNLWEWIRAELTPEGYQDWRHPGISFRAAGLPLTYDNRAKCERLFLVLFGRPMPEELGYLCPACQTRAELELPALALEDQGDPVRPQPRFYIGEW